MRHRLQRLIVILLTGFLLVTGCLDSVYAQQRRNNRSAPAQSSRGSSSQQRTNAQNTRGRGRSKQKPKRQQSRQAYEKQQRELQRQIRENEQLLNSNNQSLRSQNRDIRIREDEIRKRQELIDNQQQEIEALIADEDSLKQDIQNLEKIHQATKEKYAAAMRHMYRWHKGYNEILFVISASDLFESMRRMRYLRNYGDWRKEQARNINLQRDALNAAREELAAARAERELKLQELNNERLALSQKQQQQQAQLAQLERRNRELQGELERDRQRMAEVERNLQKIIEEEVRRAEEARRKAEEEARRKAEAERRAREQQAQRGGNSGNHSGGGNTGGGSGGGGSRPASGGSSTPRQDDSYRRLTGSFSSNKGRMPYPVDAGFAFVERYNQSGNGNSSIVLSTRTGAHATAIYDGVVSKCYSSSEEWTVIVEHGEFRSVYMNLRNVSVSVGQKVTTRQQLGTLKTEPGSNRAEIRFWIYRNASPVNPEQWLKR